MDAAPAPVPFITAGFEVRFCARRLSGRRCSSRLARAHRRDRDRRALGARGGRQGARHHVGDLATLPTALVSRRDVGRPGYDLSSITLPLGSANLALVLPFSRPSGSTVGRSSQVIDERSSRANTASSSSAGSAAPKWRAPCCFRREHLVGLFLQRELHPVEPHVGEALLASDTSRCAPERVDVERQRGVELGDRERQVEERLHGRRTVVPGVVAAAADSVSGRRGVPCDDGDAASRRGRTTPGRRRARPRWCRATAAT